MKAKVISMFRKWDNVKRIAEEVNPRAKPRPSGPSRMWGVHVKSKNRRTTWPRDSLAFGLVVTFKEMKGENRYDDFVQMCEQRGWIVNRVSVQNHSTSSPVPSKRLGWSES